MGGLTGVALANASLDVAFHDKNIKISHKQLINNINISNIRYYSTNSKNILNINHYIYAFFVGLFDGDGSIQVNHWKALHLQFRLVIKLKNLPNNLIILLKLSNFLGGNIKILTGFVLWVINDSLKIIHFIKIFDKYPLITNHKRFQLAFLKSIYEIYKKDKKLAINLYINDRNSKYNMNLYIIYYNINYTSQNYYTLINYPLFNYKDNLNLFEYKYINNWFAGFTEAEGCFVNRKNGNYSFIIAQNDKLLINFIKNYFNINNKIIINKKTYILETYKKDNLLLFISFFNKYLLQGNKLFQYNNWKKIIN